MRSIFFIGTLVALVGCATSHEKAEQYCAGNYDFTYKSHLECVQSEEPHMNKGWKAAGILLKGTADGIQRGSASTQPISAPAQQNSAPAANLFNQPVNCTSQNLGGQSTQTANDI